MQTRDIRIRMVIVARRRMNKLLILAGHIIMPRMTGEVRMARQRRMARTIRMIIMTILVRLIRVARLADL